MPTVIADGGSNGARRISAESASSVTRDAYRTAAIATRRMRRLPQRPPRISGPAMRLVTLPGVFRPRSDSWMLARHLCAQIRPGARVLDLCTGSGAIAVSAAMAGAGAVTAVDVSRRAVLTAELNARLNGVRVRGRRGRLFQPVAGERFDAIASNPPYLPAEDDALPSRGPTRATDAGADGRVLLDEICREAPAHLRPGGALLVVHSSVIGVDRTEALLEQAGLRVDVLERRHGPLGPILTARAPLLEARGLLAPGVREEDVVVVRGLAA
jgi:release factor glutamine methyltransferase